MLIATRGIKALIIGIIILAFLLAIFLIALNIFLLLIPVVVVLAVIGYLWSLFRKNKKGTFTAKHIDVKYKVKE